MQRPATGLTVLPHDPGCPGFRVIRWLVCLLVGIALIAGSWAAEAPANPPTTDEFSSLVKLAPFVVNGKSLAVSIYARTRSDRRYGEAFSGEVIKVVYEAVTESTGRGLVIVGVKGEPHPIVVFRKFLALAKEEKLDPEIAAHARELQTMVDNWQTMSNGTSRRAGKSSGGPDLKVEKLIEAFPLPLEGVGAKLYQLAWEQKFDDAKVEAALRGLRAGDLERRDRFKAYDWVFYLPEKGAFDRGLDDVIAEALKQEKRIGFFARTAIKGVLLVVKPKIRRAIEGMRQGVMFMTVVKAQTSLSSAETRNLLDAYVEVFQPFHPKGKPPLEGDTDHERLVNALRARLKKIAEKSKAPVEAGETDAPQLEASSESK
jgi:hypothetical protein